MARIIKKRIEDIEKFLASNCGREKASFLARINSLGSVSGRLCATGFYNEKTNSLMYDVPEFIVEYHRNTNDPIFISLPSFFFSKQMIEISSGCLGPKCSLLFSFPTKIGFSFRVFKGEVVWIPENLGMINDLKDVESFSSEKRWLIAEACRNFKFARERFILREPERPVCFVKENLVVFLSKPIDRFCSLEIQRKCFPLDCPFVFSVGAVHADGQISLGEYIYRSASPISFYLGVYFIMDDSYRRLLILDSLFDWVIL
jgi:hypothetical protein